eukprot:CAMPEP_0180696416 /NCGR_PEP_ID=MMETSP1038_2-20121128/2962_1 /TAXON_ID=632150 /ORGANISM="Azadinium spinosum, Strain 3D9" /LENGTH=312 /DNA_ID=CAMNT_0022727883 /DNA_START=44 /DNA_END=980 /DNA_ORIENTATION=-
MAAQCSCVVLLTIIPGLLLAWGMLLAPDGFAAGTIVAVSAGVFGTLCIVGIFFIVTDYSYNAHAVDHKVHTMLTTRLASYDDAIIALLLDGTIRLCFLRMDSAFGGAALLKRRQELPERAFVSRFKAAELFRAGAVLVLSHGWLLEGNPDPLGDASVFALFWDWASLPQGDDRSDVQKQLFKRALPIMSFMYGSPRTTVLIVKEIPEPSEDMPKYNATPYNKRGWCIMESAVAAFVAYYTGKKELVQELHLDRAPTSPEIYQPDLKAVERALTKAVFTNGKGDQERVLGQLRQFNAVFQGARVSVGQRRVLP